MTDDERMLLAEVAENTRVIAQLLAVSLPKGFSARLARALGSESKRIAYESSDGVRSAREVARLADTTHPTIGRWWAEWEQMGLVRDPGSGRMKATFDLRLLTLADRLEEALS